MNMIWGSNKAYQEELMELCHLDIPYEKLRNQRILITGANGMIGSYLVDILMKMNAVHGLNLDVTALIRSKDNAKKRFADYLDQDHFTLLLGDVCQKELFANQTWDYVIHGAGNAHPKAFAAQPVETMKANIAGTINVLDYAVSQEVRNHVKKIVLLSTGEIYGHAPIEEESGWTEDTMGVIDSMSVRSCYPESKRAAETLCQSYYSEYGVQAAIVRLSYIYGATVTTDNTRADAQFLKNALEGREIVMKSAGTQLRSYCYLQDAAEAILWVMLSGLAGEAYNVANAGSNVTIREYAECLAKVFGVEIRMEHPDEIEKSGYSTMQYEILNAAKLQKLGWQPHHNLQAGITKTKNILQNQTQQ